MTTFPAILKVIGIVLLVLVLLVLVLLLLVLFVPVRFSVDAVIPDTPTGEGFLEHVKTESSGNAKFHWLLHAVRGWFRYPGDDSFCVKVLFFQIIPQKENKEPASGGEEKHKGKETPEQREEPIQQEEPVTEEEPVTTEDSVTAVEPEMPEKPVTAEAPVKAEKTVRQKEPVKQDETESLSVLLPRFFATIFEILSLVLTKPYEVLLKIQYTISSVCDKIDDVRGFMDSSLFDRAKTVVLKQAGRLLRGIKPKRCDVRILLGTGDPALTADVLAAFSVFYPLFGGGIYVEPDFDQGIVGLRAHLKGRITIFRVLTCAGIVYFNKDVRKAYKKAKRILRK